MLQNTPDALHSQSIPRKFTFLICGVIFMLFTTFFVVLDPIQLDEAAAQPHKVWWQFTRIEIFCVICHVLNFNGLFLMKSFFAKFVQCMFAPFFHWSCAIQTSGSNAGDSFQSATMHHNGLRPNQLWFVWACHWIRKLFFTSNFLFCVSDWSILHHIFSVLWPMFTHDSKLFRRWHAILTLQWAFHGVLQLAMIWIPLIQITLALDFFFGSFTIVSIIFCWNNWVEHSWLPPSKQSTSNMHSQGNDRQLCAVIKTIFWGCQQSNQHQHSHWLVIVFSAMHQCNHDCN